MFLLHSKFMILNVFVFLASSSGEVRDVTAEVPGAEFISTLNVEIYEVE